MGPGIRDFAGEGLSPCAFIAPPGEGTAAVRRCIAGFGAFRRVAESPRGGGAFYIPDFHRTSRHPWLVPERVEVLDVVPTTSAQELCRGATFCDPKQSDVESEVRDIHRRIESGEWLKIVPVWFSKSTWVPTPEESRSLIKNTFAAPQDQMPYGLVEGDAGVLGVTPEILFQVDASGVLTTMALAGTQRVASDVEAADLLADRKERDEHQLVIDFIGGALENLGAVSIGETTVREVPGLRHLFTPITLHPKTRLVFEDVVDRLHPTPALGAVPREAGLEWLRAREGQVPRSRHGAPFGIILPNGAMICLVAIRNIQWDRSGSMIGAGCGIVHGSTPEREYREAMAKIAAVKSMLRISS